MAFISDLYDGWRDLMDNKSDQRVKDWFLMSSPIPTEVICLVYIYSVKVIGPKLMENRKPFKLKEVMIVYNLFHVIFNSWMFYKACTMAWFAGYSWRCEPVDHTSIHGHNIAIMCWWYYMNKFSDFVDTIFFIMRKRFDQVSGLHVFHHAIMPHMVWWGLKFVPGGHATFFGFLNSLVHVVMYTYYSLAAMGPAVQKYLWWKKYLTMFQIAQFVAIFLHTFQLLIWNPCNFPTFFINYIMVHSIIFFTLFMNFYIGAYNSKKSLSVKESVHGKELAGKSE